MTGMRPMFGVGWLLLGHSFAAEQEHDQAINCYLKAAKLLAGCHLPLLYIGVEYGLSNNLHLGEKFVKQASSLAPDDPAVLNELGVVAYRGEKYVEAKQYFMKALGRVLNDEQTDSQSMESIATDDEKPAPERSLASRLNRPIPDLWEPLLCNLGNVLRQPRFGPVTETSQIREACACHQRALALNPKDPAALGSLAVSCLLGEIQVEKAIELLHQVLALKCENANVFRSLLNKSMEFAASPWVAAQRTPPLHRELMYQAIERNPEMEVQQEQILDMVPRMATKDGSASSTGEGLGLGLGGAKGDDTSGAIQEVDMEETV